MTNALEQGLLHGIPRHEAADFYLRIKKAGWADAPDETGTLEGQFTVPVEQVTSLVAQAAAEKFKLMIAYHVYAESMRGVAQHACAEVFHEHAEHERKAAEAYLKRAAVLGSGPVHLPECEPPPASSDPVGILMALARAEQEAIALQGQLREAVGETNPLRFQIEQFMVEDQHHLDELWQMLPQDVQRAPVIEQPPAQEGPMEEFPAEEAPAPAAKKEASGLMSFRKSFKGVPMEEAGKAVGEAPGGAWSKLRDVLHSPLTPGKAGLYGAGIGAASGALMGSAQALLPPAAKQEAAEESGPIGRFMLRHPILTGAALMGSTGAAGGYSGPRLAEVIIKTRGNPPAREVLKWAPLNAAPLAVTGVLKSIDGALHDREERELSKSASVTQHLKSLGRKMRAGASRYGELLTGSKAKSLAESAAGLRSRAKANAQIAIEGANRMGPAEKGKTIDVVRKSLLNARKAGDAAVEENTKSRVTQAATAAGVVGATATAAGLKHRKDQKKIDATNALLKKNAFAQCLKKLALAPMEPGMGTDPAAAPMPDAQQSFVPLGSMEQPGVQPPMANPPGSARYAPVNYLEAEAVARQAQEQNEAAFYRSKAEEAGAQVQGMGAQVQEIQAQLDELAAQAAQSQAQIMAANEEAVRANDQMLNQATLAARMRMGMQQLRAQMMEVASQDPEQLAAAAGGPTPMDVGMQAQQAAAEPAPMGGAPGGDPTVAPGAQPGTPEASPDPSTAPGSPPASSGGPSGSGGASESSNSDGGGTDKEKKDSGGETTVSIKKGSVKRAGIYEESLLKLPAMAIGGGIGAGVGYYNAKKGKEIPDLRAKVNELKGQQREGGFDRAIELSKTQMQLAEAEWANKDPARAALKGGLLGASMGGGLVTTIPALVSGGKELYQGLRALQALGKQAG